MAVAEKRKVGLFESNSMVLENFCPFLLSPQYPLHHHHYHHSDGDNKTYA